MITIYIYAFVSVIIVSLISLIGVFSLSIKEEFIKKYIGLFISLAVGALLGDALIHLIPETFKNSSNSVFVSLLIISGILVFFTFFVIFIKRKSKRRIKKKIGKKDNKINLMIISVLVFLFLFVVIQRRKRNYVFDKILDFFKQLFGFSGNTEIITSDFHNLGVGNFLIGKWIILFTN